MGAPLLQPTQSKRRKQDPFHRRRSVSCCDPVRCIIIFPTTSVTGFQSTTRTADRHEPSLNLPTNHPPPAKLDLSPEHSVARRELLREAFFPNWKDAAGAGSDLDHPDEMQKKDPLATQIWKLYSKTKTQLPNQERMENLTWRMMAMNLKRKEREQARSVRTMMLASFQSNSELQD